MSGIYGSFTPRENWHIGQDDWIERRPYLGDYYPAHRALPGYDEWNESGTFLIDSRPARRTLIHRAPSQSIRDDMLTGRRSGSLSLLPPAPTYSPERFLLIENDTARSTYPSYRQPVPDSPPPRYYQPQYSPPSELESRFTKEEQEGCLSKLRKVMIFNPHLSNIVRRMGMKNKTDGTNQSGESRNFQDTDGRRCAICLDDFDSKQFVMLTPCDHMFHEDCIVPWVKSQGKCPVCRFVICKK